METPSTPPIHVTKSLHPLNMVTQKEITETRLTLTSNATQDKTNQWDHDLNIFTAKPTPELVPGLDRFIEMTKTIVTKLSEPDSTTEIKVNDEMRVQVQQMLLRIPFKYPKINWRTIQDTLSQYLPAILYANYPNIVSPSNIDQFAFCIKDAIKRAVLATPRKLTPCPYANRWWNDDISILRKQSHRLRNIYRRTRHEYDKIIWREKANEWRDAIRIAKEKTWRQFVSTSFSSTSTEQDPTIRLRDCELSQERRHSSTAYYEFNSNVITAMFIANLEILTHRFPEKSEL